MPLFSGPQLQQYAMSEASRLPQTSSQTQALSSDQSLAKQHESLSPYLLALINGSNDFDGITSKMAIDRGAHEVNPLFSSLGSNGVLGAKIGVGAGESLLFHEMAKSHPKLAKYLAIGASAVPLIAGISNMRQK